MTTRSCDYACASIYYHLIFVVHYAENNFSKLLINIIFTIFKIENSK